MKGVSIEFSRGDAFVVLLCVHELYVELPISYLLPPVNFCFLLYFA